MKKYFGWGLSFFIVMNSSGVSSVFGADTAASDSGSSAPAVEMGSSPETNPLPGKSYLESQAAWQERLSEVKGQRNILYVLGIGGTVAGVALIAGGVSDNNDAKNTPGCSQSGTTVYCKDAETTKQAQDKIDEGDQKMLTGSVAALAGAGLIVWGALRGGKARRIEAEGKNKGYSFDLRPHRDGATLVLNRSF